MIRRGSAGLVLVAVLALVVAARSEPAARTPAAAPLLWQGLLGAHQVSLFGTIHVPDPRVLALSPPVRVAFDRADRVVTEIPLDGAQQAELAAALVLPDGQRLRAIVGEAMFARLEARVRAALTPIAPEMAPLVAGMLDRLKPWAALSQLATLEYLPDLLAGRTPLDVKLYGEAVAAGKKVGGLETVAEQAGTFDAFSPEEQATLLDEALRDFEAPAGPTGKQLVEWYLEGNGDKLAAALSQGSRNDALARKFEAEVLVKRNHRMADRIDDLRRDAPGETLFVAVGALHLVGSDNLPQLLQARGYEISRVRP
ncbi:TraB family protein [Luteitalea pratensis]|uniref:TraB family protein n=1 Tax=Luteitalea pratensis TaxID=1855912 RepID=A0A143PUG1_LUTPR|nr:TraB/GumN family protein [Luteitalea pratensis]AMY12367.1 TraB family protein [Luteitalea pratensis]